MLEDEIDEHKNQHERLNHQILKLKADRNVIITKSKKRKLEIKALEISKTDDVNLKQKIEGKYYELYKKF